MKYLSKLNLKWLSALALGATLLLGSGCVSEKIEPEHKPRLGVAQGGDGWVTINLETQVGFKYQILYEDPKDRQWKPIQGCDSISGTGGVVEIRKRFNSRKALPPFTVTYSNE